jgi:hypothetical protein
LFAPGLAAVGLIDLICPTCPACLMSANSANNETANKPLQLQLKQADLAIYRATTLGKSYLEALKQLVAQGEIQQTHADKAITIYDSTVNQQFNSLQEINLMFSGELQTYRYVDKMWILLARHIALDLTNTAGQTKSKKKKKKRKRKTKKKSSDSEEDEDSDESEEEDYSSEAGDSEEDGDVNYTPTESNMILGKRVKIIACEAKKKSNH